MKNYFIQISIFLLIQNIIILQAANSGKIIYSNGPKQDSLATFSVNGSWDSFDKNPRFLGDIDGDGKDDIIGFGDTQIFVAFGKDTSPYFESPQPYSTSFGFESTDFAYTSQNVYPRMVADVDGDGKDDLIGFEEDGIFVAFSNGRANFEPKMQISDHYTPTQGGYINYNTYPRFFADIDGDGKADLVSIIGGGVATRFSKGRATLDSAVLTAPYFSPDQGFTNQNQYPRLVGDFDGDGKADIIGFGENDIWISFFTGTQFLAPQNVLSNALVKGASWSSFDVHPRHIADYNNDGKADIIGSASTHYTARPSKGRSHLGTTYSDLIFSFGYNDSTGTYTTFDLSPRHMGDVNGDGLLDIVGFAEEGVQIAFGQKSCSHATRDVTADCACKPGFYDAGDDAECPACTYPCENCTSPTDCLSCASTDYRLDTSSCDCSPGYYDNNTSACIECPKRYGTCDDATTPQTCDGNNRKPKADDCVCSDGFYENASPTAVDCLECPKRYGTCTNDTTPQTCDGNNRKPKANDCVCQEGYYEDLSPSVVDCIECPKRYGTCDDATTPQTCDGTNRKPKADDCVCLDGFYEDPSPSVVDCVECPKRYGTCDDATTPQTCDGTNRKPKEDDCVCSDGYYEDPSPIAVDCLECPKRYGTCTNDTTPQTCDGNNRKPKADDCVCQDGYYEDSSPSVVDCIECPKRYGTCDDASTPQTCDGNNRKVKADDCVCQDGFYEDPSPSVVDCVECPKRYGTCTNDSTPQTCDGINRKAKVDDCVCLDGYYEDPSPIAVDCLECPKRYATCSNDSTALICDGNNRKAKEDDCVCQDGYYEDASPIAVDCLQCRDRYGTCSDETTPLSCQGNFRKGTGDDCLCQDGYYEDPDSVNCIACEYPCSNCSSATDCIGCRSSQSLRKTTSSCECNDGYYDNQEECLQCVYPCVHCSSESICVDTCYTTANRNTAPSCSCQDGYYDDVSGTKSCVSCTYPCENCSGESVCLSCKTPENRVSLIDCRCQDGFYEDGSQCSQCDYRKCITCRTGPGDCGIPCPSTCGYCNIDGTCKACKIGYYMKPDGQCDSCHPKCFSCFNSSENCNYCQSEGIGRSENLANQCDCIEGYYENGEELDCVKCENSNCKRCLSNGECLECFNSSLIPPLCAEDKPIKQGFFSLQVQDGDNGTTFVEAKCDIKCQKCQETSTNCTQCRLASFRDETTCGCLEGYHDNEGNTQNCQKCPKFCLKCTSNENCLQCDDEMNVVLDRFQGKCVCGYGYKENSQGVCSKCYSYQEKCVFECPQNTMQNEELFVCYDMLYTQSGKFNSSLWIGSGGILAVIILSWFVLSKTFKSAGKHRIQHSAKISTDLQQVEVNQSD